MAAPACDETGLAWTLADAATVEAAPAQDSADMAGSMSNPAIENFISQ
jgi:hypothetical protein